MEFSRAFPPPQQRGDNKRFRGWSKGAETNKRDGATREGSASLFRRDEGSYGKRKACSKPAIFCARYCSITLRRLFTSDTHRAVWVKKRASSSSAPPKLETRPPKSSLRHRRPLSSRCSTSISKAREAMTSPLARADSAARSTASLHTVLRSTP